MQYITTNNASYVLLRMLEEGVGWGVFVRTSKVMGLGDGPKSSISLCKVCRGLLLCQRTDRTSTLMAAQP